MECQQLFERVKQASRQLALLIDDEKNKVLHAVADAIDKNHEVLLQANQQDLDRMSKDNPLYDRLQLTHQRLNDIANDMRKVSELPSPLHKIILEKVLPNGLKLRKISVPFGVIGVVYEARPNVTFDVFSLCLKSGNASILKGGKDADCSNRAAIELIHNTLEKSGVNPHIVDLLPATHEATAEMLAATEYIDVCIPRGGRNLIQFVRNNAKVPVIETGAGVVNCYFDEWGDLEKGKAIVNNAKTRRVSVCNALDCLIVHKERLNDLSELCAPLQDSNVRIYADEPSYNALKSSYPTNLLLNASEDSYGTEYMDYAMALKTVDSIDDALSHIQAFGSGHSESIITENEQNAERFQMEVDASSVYVNAPTSFTDGGQFGMGAEIGISTQKLGPRGPMGLEEMTTYKWLINGNGQTRP